MESREPKVLFFLKSVGILASLIVMAVALMITALSFTTPSECATVQTTQGRLTHRNPIRFFSETLFAVALVYFTAVVFFRQKVLLVKVFIGHLPYKNRCVVLDILMQQVSAIGLCMAGVALIACARGLQSVSAFGVLLAFLSTAIFVFNIVRNFSRDIYTSIRFLLCTNECSCSYTTSHLIEEMENYLHAL